MPGKDTALSFRKASVGDLPILHDWMGQAHWQQWWNEPEPDAEIELIRNMIEGRDTTEPWMILHSGEPVGYIQCWFVKDNLGPEVLAEHPWLIRVPVDSVGIDLSVGPESLLSRGIGSAALRLFAEELCARGHRTIIIDPDPANVRARRAYAKAGFRDRPEYTGDAADVSIMQYAPGEADEMDK